MLATAFGKQLIETIAKLIADQWGVWPHLNQPVGNPGRYLLQPGKGQGAVEVRMVGKVLRDRSPGIRHLANCLLYTSDAADE